MEAVGKIGKYDYIHNYVSVCIEPSGVEMIRIPVRSVMLAFILFTLLSVPIPEAKGEEAVTGRLQISDGLPQETASFTTVEVFDSDRNGLDEIFMGGAGFVESQVRVEGIRAYEYDSSMGSWQEFGSGLPGDGSGKYYGAIGLGDINDDGEMDIAAPKPSRWYDIDVAENGIDIYTGDGSGNFEFLHTISLPDTYMGSSNEAEIYDLDGDGHGDVIASTYRGVKIWFGDGTGTNLDDQSPILLISGDLEVGGVGIGDLNNDGLLDVVATPYQGSTNVMMYIQVAGRNWNQVDFKETDNGFGIKVQDLDGDGNSDVVYGTRTEGIRAWLGQGTTNLQGFPCTDASACLPDTGGDYDQVELGDVNNDGKPDLIVSGDKDEIAQLFINDLPTGWTEIFTGDDRLVVGGTAYGANFGDWDGDGNLDIAACAWEGGADAWIVTRDSTVPNAPPVADAGPAQTADLGEVVYLDGTESYDPDGTISEWDWECTSHAYVSLDNGDGPTPYFTSEQEGEHLFTLRVKDDDNQWSSVSEVTVDIVNPTVNSPPIADAGEDMDAYVGDTVTLDGTGSRDPDGTIVEYVWACTSHTVTLEDDDTAEPSFTPGSEDEYVFTLVVKDDLGLSSSRDEVSAFITYRLVMPGIGPFLHDDDTAVKNALATLYNDDDSYTSMTDSGGYAQFSDGVKPGDYSCILELEERRVVEPFSVTLSLDGSVTLPGGEIPRVVKGEEEPTSSEPESASEEGLPIVPVIVGILAVIVIGAGLYFFMTRSKSTPVQAETVQAVVPNCPECGQPLQYVADFNRHYCQACQEYR